jgi:hypothetical protein
MPGAVTFFAFLSIFQIVGLALLWGSLRTMIRARRVLFQPLVMTVFGGLFALAPLRMGFEERGLPFMAVQATFGLVLLIVIIVVWPHLERTGAGGSAEWIPLLLGGVLVIAGLSAVGESLGRGDYLRAVGFGVGVVGGGGFFLALGLRELLRKSDREE